MTSDLWLAMLLLLVLNVTIIYSVCFGSFTRYDPADPDMHDEDDPFPGYRDE